MTDHVSYSKIVCEKWLNDINAHNFTAVGSEKTVAQTFLFLSLKKVEIFFIDRSEKDIAIKITTLTTTIYDCSLAMLTEIERSQVDKNASDIARDFIHVKPNFMTHVKPIELLKSGN